MMQFISISFSKPLHYDSMQSFIRVLNVHFPHNFFSFRRLLITQEYLQLNCARIFQRNTVNKITATVSDFIVTLT